MACVATFATLSAGCASAPPVPPAAAAATAEQATPVRTTAPAPFAESPPPERCLPDDVHPRISVAISDAGVEGSVSVNDPREGSAAGDLLIQALLDCGFVVVDRRVEEARAAAATAPGGGAPIELLPDLHIVGEAKKLRTVSSVSARAVIPHSNVVLTRAHGYGSTPAVAGRQAAENLSRQVARLWNGEADKGRVVQLVVAGLGSRRQGREIEQALAGHPDGIPHLQVYGYKGGAIMLELESRLDSPAIVQLLTALRFDGARLGVEEARHFAVFMRMHHAEEAGASAGPTAAPAGGQAGSVPAAP